MKKTFLLLIFALFFGWTRIVDAEENIILPSPEVTVVPTASPSPTATVTASPSPTTTVTASPTSAATSAPTVTPKATVAVRTAAPISTPEESATPTVLPTATPVATFLPIEIGSGGNQTGFTGTGSAIAAQGGPGLLVNLLVFLVALGIGLLGYFWSGKRTAFLERFLGRFRKNQMKKPLPIVSDSSTESNLVRPLRPRK